jgi:hypothetical protein
MPSASSLFVRNNKASLTPALVRKQNRFSDLFDCFQKKAPPMFLNASVCFSTAKF